MCSTQEVDFAKVCEPCECDMATSRSRPQDRAGWLDVHCISKKNDSFPLVTGIPGQIQLFPWVSHSANLYLKTGFAPELEAMWRRTQHCTPPSTQLLFTARFKKEIFVKELLSTNPEPLTAMKPSKPLKIYWQYVWRRSSLAGCRRPTDPLHSSCCPFTHSFLILSNNLCQHFSG